MLHFVTDILGLFSHIKTKWKEKWKFEAEIFEADLDVTNPGIIISAQFNDDLRENLANAMKHIMANMDTMKANKWDHFLQTYQFHFGLSTSFWFGPRPNKSRNKPRITEHDEILDVSKFVKLFAHHIHTYVSI